MYLVARQESQAATLVDLLQRNGYPATWLPLMSIKKNLEALELAKNGLTRASLIMVTAPAVIECLSSNISLLLTERHTIIVPGLATAIKLRSITKAQIISPQNGSGIEAIRNEGVFKRYSGQNLLILGGDTINPRLVKLLGELNVNYEYISLYQRINVGIKNIKQIEKLILKPEIAGIIIASKQIASYFIDCVSLLGIENRMKDLLLISIHGQITDFLIANGYKNVHQTLSSSNDSILRLIKGY